MSIVDPGAPDRATVSVVIVTIGRPRQLAASLESYARLAEGTPPFEVIVVLDGFNAETEAVARRPYPFPVSVKSQPHAGIGPAKNLGASAATGDLLLFLNDDTRPDPLCLRAHVDAQERFGPTIALGRIDWDPAREVTPYMAWLAPAGHQFNFTRLREDDLIPWDACWGAHLALPRPWLLDEPFDPNLPYSAIEDGEWAYRQALRGRPIRYVPAARVLHDHLATGPRDFRGRARGAGATARYVARRHPGLVVPLLLRPAVTAVAATLLMAWPGRWRRTAVWDLDYRWAYVTGLLAPSRSVASNRPGERLVADATGRARHSSRDKPA